eukprot:TRINITY_DN1741_c1_g2_i1.p2 TRINITY_DN1741_c1_g2~~TRINITY_DN1741_c1_g2_i1.p2  ORF type:complete len:153 (+),score=7.39 TRINITY_DN1741_c1_g2_i1:172-630(+)
MMVFITLQIHDKFLCTLLQNTVLGKKKKLRQIKKKIDLKLLQKKKIQTDQIQSTPINYGKNIQCWLTPKLPTFFKLLSIEKKFEKHTFLLKNGQNGCHFIYLFSSQRPLQREKILSFLLVLVRRLNMFTISFYGVLNSFIVDFQQFDIFGNQ